MRPLLSVSASQCPRWCASFFRRAARLARFGLETFDNRTVPINHSWTGASTTAHNSIDFANWSGGALHYRRTNWSFQPGPIRSKTSAHLQTRPSRPGLVSPEGIAN